MISTINPPSNSMFPIGNTSMTERVKYIKNKCVKFSQKILSENNKVVKGLERF